MADKPKSLIINSPYVRPEQHWSEGKGGALEVVTGRRPASYEVFDVTNNTKRVETLDFVNKIRERVDQWREAEWPGVTIVTRRLLEHWHDETARQYPFYFCQLEAIETLIWWVEASAEYRQGIALQGDGGPWERICNKMATGAGKTTVMAMIIAWQALNALTYPKRRKDFSKSFFIVAPGLTVKGRLQVLVPTEGSYFDEFNICPNEASRQKLNQAEVRIENWHTLMQQSRSVVKKGVESDEAFARRVLGPLANAKDLVVINDEAHHAYRKPAELKISRARAEEAGIDLDEATRWIEGLDRLHKTRRILRCFDLSATPFAPTGKKSTDTSLFDWIVSDFGLNDAIEAGLVKTPRVVVRDDALPDARTMRSKLYHIYRDPEVSEDLNRSGAQPHEDLPKLVKDAYTLLGADWRTTREQWQKAGHHSPPVMLTVCNRTETAARIEHYLNSGNTVLPEMHAPTKTLRVDSKVLEKAETGETVSANRNNRESLKAYEGHLQKIIEESGLSPTRKADLAKAKKEELLREIVDNVGKRGQAGQNLQSVISVAMLSEGWDAKNVTHIMGLRAFTSQLLCEQVIGRGLRRVSYDTDENGLFVPEYVNVFGVPLSIHDQVGEGGEALPPAKPSTQVESLPERSEHELRWPNIVRVETVIRQSLEVDWGNVEPLALDPSRTIVSAELAPAIGGAADLSKLTQIDLEKIVEDGFRLQRTIFAAARKGFLEMQRTYPGTPEYLLVQLVNIVEEYLRSNRIEMPSLFYNDPIRRRLLYALNMDRIVQNLLRHIRQNNYESLEPVFDEDHPIGSTSQMRTWFTTKPLQPTVKSQISHVVGDSAWEQYAANIFEKSESVISYAKNDHLNLHVYYLWKGSKRRYVPDFIVKLSNGKTLLLEIKGQDSEQNQAKRDAMEEWINAVNQNGKFGQWVSGVAFKPEDVHDILKRVADLLEHKPT